MADDLYEQLPDGTYRKARNARSPKLPQAYQPPVSNPSPVPEARGKAAALDAWLARGGQPFRGSGKYKKGPFKGKTIDEARAQFETMWAKAPDAVKNKYASRSLKTDLAPIEREAAAPKTPVKKPSQPDFSKEQMKPAAAPQAAAGLSFEQLTDPAQQFQPIGTDLNQDGQINDADAQANAAAVAQAQQPPATQPIQTAEQEAAALAAVAMEAGGLRQPGGQAPPPVERPTDTAPGSVWGGINTMNDAIRTQNARDQVSATDPNAATVISGMQTQGAGNLQTQGQSNAGEVAAARAQAEAQRAAETRQQAGLPPIKQPTAPAPAPVAPAAAAPTPPPIVNPAAPAPFVGPPAPGAPASPAEAPYVPLPPPATQMGGRGSVGGTSPSGIQGRQGTGASPSAPVAVRNQVAANAGVPAVMPDQAAAPMPAPTQVAAPPVARPKINSLTGLPFGYRPGDAVDPAQAAAAAESVSNQGSATAFGGIQARPSDIAAADNAMRAQGMYVPAAPVQRPGQPTQPGPASQVRPYQDPTEAGGAFSREAYASTAAAQQEGIEKQAIREGRASEATRAKHSTYAIERDRGVAMDKEIYGSGPTGAGGNFKAGDTTRYANGATGTVKSVRPATRQEARRNVTMPFSRPKPILVR